MYPSPTSLQDLEISATTAWRLVDFWRREAQKFASERGISIQDPSPEVFFALLREMEELETGVMRL